MKVYAGESDDDILESEEASADSFTMIKAEALGAGRVVGRSRQTSATSLIHVPVLALGPIVFEMSSKAEEIAINDHLLANDRTGNQENQSSLSSLLPARNASTDDLENFAPTASSIIFERAELTSELGHELGERPEDSPIGGRFVGPLDAPGMVPSEPLERAMNQTAARNEANLKHAAREHRRAPRRESRSQEAPDENTAPTVAANIEVRTEGKAKALPPLVRNTPTLGASFGRPAASLLPSKIPLFKSLPVPIHHTRLVPPQSGDLLDYDDIEDGRTCVR